MADRGTPTSLLEGSLTHHQATAMAGPRHPVSVHAAALVQTERLQTFAFSVCWSDNSNTFVRRSCDEFRSLHKTLKETFPVEAGLLRRSDRVLPKLPVSALLLARGGRTGRSLARLRLLETYLQMLLVVECVSRGPVLTGFFEPQPQDLEPSLPPGSLVILTAWEKPLPCPAGSLAIGGMVALRLRSLQPFSTQDTRGQHFLVRAQEALEVLLRHPSGWWLVANEDQQMAWFPAPYLEEVQGQGQDGGQPLERSGSQFCVSRAYEGSRVDELSVPAGARVQVLEMSDRGWWLCRFSGRTGLLPSVLLQPDGLGTFLSRPGLHSGAEGSEDGVGEAQSSPPCPQAVTLPPTVPTRPLPSAIQRCCCTITRSALGWDPQGQGPS